MPLLMFMAIGLTASTALGATIGLARLTGESSAMLARPVQPWSKPDRVAPPAIGSHGAVALRGTDGLFYVTAAVNGHPVRFVVDTGASMMVLSGADAASAGVVPQFETTPIITANGSTTMSKALVARMDVVGKSLHDVPATVANSGNQSLIGENVLAQLTSVSIRGDRMELD